MIEKNQAQGLSEYRNRGKNYGTYAGGVDGTTSACSVAQSRREEVELCRNRREDGLSVGAKKG